jgi:hypothetical protein
MKFCVYTDADLQQLRQCLKRKQCRGHPHMGRLNLGIDLLQVIDPNQNVIEII